MFIIFSESALKNVKAMKQRCSALITSGTSTRVYTFFHSNTTNYSKRSGTKIYRLLIIFRTKNTGQKQEKNVYTNENTSCFRIKFFFDRFKVVCFCDGCSCDMQVTMFFARIILSKESIWEKIDFPSSTVYHSLFFID